MFLSIRRIQRRAPFLLLVFSSIIFLFLFVGLKVCFGKEAKYESSNFVFYFEDINSDAYEDRVAIADMVEEVYNGVSERVKIRFSEKVSFYLMEPLYEGYGHGYGKASMDKSGRISLFYIYYPISTWEKNKDYDFMRPYFPAVRNEMKRGIEEEMLTALFITKYLLPQREPRIFNAALYGMTASFCKRDVHSSVRWMVDEKSINERYPISAILSNEIVIPLYDNTWDIISSRYISFGGYIIEKYGFEKFEKLLQEATPSNVKAVILKNYGKTISVLEKEWLEWLRSKVKVYDTPDMELRRKMHLEMLRFYLIGGQIKDNTARYYLLDAASCLQALVSTRKGEQDAKVFAVARQVANKRLEDLVKKHVLAKVDFYFECENPTDEVTLTGDFNEWSPWHPLYQLKATNDKNNIKHLALYLAPGRYYQYKFILNSTNWITDLTADGLVPDGFGGQNSVLVTEKGKNRVIEFKMNK